MATWKVVQLDRNTADGFVTCAHWACSAVDGEFSGSVYGSVCFSGELTVPYADLTETVVIGWVKKVLGDETVSAHEAAVAAQIESQRDPVSATGLPWAA